MNELSRTNARLKENVESKEEKISSLEQRFAFDSNNHSSISLLYVEYFEQAISQTNISSNLNEI